MTTTTEVLSHDEMLQEAIAILRECARTQRRITYGEFAKQLHIREAGSSYSINRVLNEISRTEYAERGVLLSALVVRADTRLPGIGFFKLLADKRPERAASGAGFHRELKDIFETYG